MRGPPGRPAGLPTVAESTTPGSPAPVSPFSGIVPHQIRLLMKPLAYHRVYGHGSGREPAGRQLFLVQHEPSPGFEIHHPPNGILVSPSGRLQVPVQPPTQ